MSDVGDVNRAHFSRPSEDSTPEAYMRAARRMLSPGAGMADRMAFLALHSAKNVVMLANIIDALREENGDLMNQLFGLDSKE